ncbi:MAG: Calx-beta domain-containing protein [Betaproteobacteria bacterium]
MPRFAAVPFRNLAAALCAAMVLVLTMPLATAQQLVVTPAHDTGAIAQPYPVVVFPDLGGGLPNPARTYILPFDNPILRVHALTLLAANRALASQERSGSPAGGINLLDTTNGTRIDNYLLPQPSATTFYDGYGTLAMNPAGTHVLAVTSLDTLWIIPTPFDHTAAVTMLSLPSSSNTAQTRAIAFDSVTGRAYIAVKTGIVAVDPPYTSIAFTIPSSNGGGLSSGSGSIALSPDNATLIATRGDVGTYGPELRIFHAPFSAASVPEVLTITGASLDGLTFTPDGSKVLVVESAHQVLAALPRVYAVSAPYNAASTVETLSFDPGASHDGFEDIDISADGQYAALSGGSVSNGDPLVILKAPFTAAGFTFSTIDLPYFGFPYNGGKGRGAGSARFWSTATPALPPQIFVDETANIGILGPIYVPEGNVGTQDVVIKVDLSAPSALTVSVDYTTVDGTGQKGATAADNDYIPASGTLTFAPGEVTKSFIVKVVGDTKYESDQRFTAVISNPVNATLLAPQPGFADTGTIVIVNDDAAVTAAITTTALPDGVTGVPYLFQLTGTGADPLLWGPATLPDGLSLDPTTGIVSGIPTTAGPFSAYVTLVDADAHSDTRNFPMIINSNGAPVLLPSPNPLDFGSRTVGTTGPIISATVTNVGGANLVLGNPFALIVMGNDFAFASGAGACVNGQTLAPATNCALYFTFTPKAAGTRTLVLNLASNAAAATMTLTGVGTGAALPVVSIANASAVTEGNSGTTPMTFAVTLSPVSASAVTVNYAATGGTATAGVDYTVAGSGTLTFAPGVTAQNITVNVNGDTLVEPDETIVITLSAPGGATLGTATATGTILNDDVAAGALLALMSAPPVFGNQALATTSLARSVTIGNTGGSSLVLATPFAALPPGADFAYTTGQNSCAAGKTLAPASVCNLYLTFTPSALGTRTANVTLSSNAPDVTMVLSGVGVTAPPPSSVQPIPTLSPTMLALLIAMMGMLGWVSLRMTSRR